LIEAAASVLRRVGSKLAMYNLGQGPQGFVDLREFMADKLNRHRGMDISRDEVLITTGRVRASTSSADIGTLEPRTAWTARACGRGEATGARHDVGGPARQHGLRIEPSIE
jgi:hypothetical protein